MNVKIINGLYRGNVINGTYTVIKPWTDGSRGGYITVKSDGNTIFQTNAPRINVDQANCILLDEHGEELSEQHVMVLDTTGTVITETNYEDAFLASETDEDAMTRIRHTFGMLDRITDSVSRGIIRGLVVSGPPGIGKSFGVEKQLSVANMFNALKGAIQYEIVSGEASAIGLYQILYKNKDAGFVTCFDDSDGILFDEECITLLKGALNSGDRRRICWHKESRTLKREDIPDAFDFNGSIIFLTNEDFEKVISRGSRIGAHLSAIVSRCHYMDLEISTMRDKLLRIKQIVGDGMLSKYEFEHNEEELIVDWIYENKDTLREVSLRMVSKLADFIKSEPEHWKEFAEATVLTREAKFKRLFKKLS